MDIPRRCTRVQRTRRNLTLSDGAASSDSASSLVSLNAQQARRGIKRRAVQRRWLGSHAVRVAATVIANKKLPPKRRSALPVLFAAASKLDVRAPITEPARLYGKAKSSGGHRPIWDFGLIRRAAVEMVRPMLRPYARPRRFQYDHKGVNLAIKRIKAALAAGLVYAVRIDIKDHYGSFRAETLPSQLPLPKKLVDHVVFGKDIPVDVVEVPSLSPDLATKARRGIPQGSGLSPMVALTITSRLNWQAPKGVRMFNYADDFQIMAATEYDANAAADALGDAIAKLPGGQFSLKRWPTRHIDDCIEFLGHSLEMSQGELVVMPTLATLDRLIGRLEEYENYARKPLIKLPANFPPEINVRLNALGDAWVLARTWAAAFRECNTITDELAFIRCTLDHDLRWFKQPPEFLDSYKNDQAAWKHSCSMYGASGG